MRNAFKRFIMWPSFFFLVIQKFKPYEENHIPDNSILVTPETTFSKSKD